MQVRTFQIQWVSDNPTPVDGSCLSYAKGYGARTAQDEWLPVDGLAGRAVRSLGYTAVLWGHGVPGGLTSNTAWSLSWVSAPGAGPFPCLQASY